MSITLSADVQGAQKWLTDFSKDVQKAIDAAVTATALETITEVKRMIQRGPKTGKTYTRAKGQNKSRKHQSSAPGEAPATDTGTLASSIYFKKTSPRVATVGSRLAYAAYLEFGTQRIAPRPSWTPSVEKMQPKLNHRVSRAIDREAKK